MRQHFSIGVGSELVTAFALQLFAQRRIIFDHAVVHKRDFSALVKVRMRVFVGHFSMSSPARVADAVLPRGRFLGHQFGQVRSEEHTSELQSPYDLVCRLLLEKKKKKNKTTQYI